MKLTQRLPILALVTAAGALLFGSGCSSSTTPPTTPSQVTYTSGSSYTYLQESLDTTNGTYGYDQPDPATKDTITTTVLVADTALYGKTNATVLVNKHSNGSSNDTSYIAQESGNYWHYNYGFEALNSNQAVIGVLKNPIEAGWVLQGKFTAAPGTTWQAVDTSISVPYNGLSIPVSITDTATEQGDTTITIKGKFMTAKHALHIVTMNALGGTIATMPIDTYITTDEGVILNVVHSFRVQATGIVNAQVRGQSTAMTSF